MDLAATPIVVKPGLRYANDMAGVLPDIGESYMNLHRPGSEVIFREAKIGGIAQ